VLGTIGQYNYRRYYDEVGARAPEGFHRLVEKGEHLDYARPCNAMSISQSTGIPRETVRRKIRELIARGWVRRAGANQLFVTRAPARHFAEFDLETLEHFYDAARDLLQLVEKRTRR
jgi:DNA-binding IclR family transcriptional regulator